MPTIPLVDTLARPCRSAAGDEGVRTVGELAAFSLRQEAALQTCEARRAGLVQLIADHNRLAASGGGR